MSRGKARAKLLAHSVGLVEGSSGGPSWDFIYNQSTIKHPDFNIGDHVVLPDGREFVYAKSVGACVSGQGAEFTYAGYLAYTSFVVAVAAGDSEITIPAGTHAALTTDELRGGYVNIFNPSGSNSVQFRGIVGNASADADALFKVQLDGKLSEAITASSAVEVFQNPYAALQTGTMNYNPKAGIPAVEITAASVFFFVQKSGPAWIAPQGGKLGTTEGGYSGGLWSDVGNISDYNTSLGVTVAVERGSQHAGFAILGDADNIGPLFMLQG